MNQASRVQYLQQMGIIAYVPRGVAPAFETAESIKPSVFGNPNSPASKIIILLRTSILDWASPEHQLLKKIMGSVGLPDEAVAICYSPEIPFEMPLMNQTAKVIAFGSNLTVSLPKGSVETLDLDQLQQNDSAKRQLWQELKAIKAAYGY